MPYHLTSAQRCVLADSVRAGLVGWLLTCPVTGRQSRILKGKATNILGFGFSRWLYSGFGVVDTGLKSQS